MELELERLTKRFGARAAVDGVSCTLRPGVTGLLGSNGAGKTTLMRMVCSVLEPTGGRILLDGADARSLGADYRARLGYLPQDFGFYPDFTARDFMLYLAACKGLNRRDAARQTEELLAQVGLAQHARTRVRAFSGGMRQRLGIAQAVLGDPAILVLDEPTAGLDPKERVRFRNLIAGLAKDRIVVLSTHIVSDVEHIAGRILMMREGRLVGDGRPGELVEQARGSVWEARVDEAQAAALEGRPDVAGMSYLEGGGAVVRLVGREPGVAGAVPAEPTLEDLFLLSFAE